MTIADVLDATYAGLIEDISPPLSRAEARTEMDRILDAPEADAETWGTTSDAVTGRRAAESSFGAAR